jgi:hypothetical protein
MSEALLLRPPAAVRDRLTAEATSLRVSVNALVTRILAERYGVDPPPIARLEGQTPAERAELHRQRAREAIRRRTAQKRGEG